MTKENGLTVVNPHFPDGTPSCKITLEINANYPLK